MYHSIIYACYHYLVLDLVSFYLHTSIAHKTGYSAKANFFLARCKIGGPLCHSQNFSGKKV